MKLQTESSHTQCPLCGSSEFVILSRTPYSEIWTNLRLEWGISLTDDTKRTHSIESYVSLQHCSKCNLQYFSPALPGNSQFYAEITSSCPHYYTKDKWEFEYVRRFLKRDHKILDVACGKGAFLRSVLNEVDVATGIDTNPDVMRGRTDTKFQIYNQTIAEFSKEYGEEFDFVSAFQVIEHLGSVMPFVSAAYQCVKPGGLLVLSVPNRERRRDLSFGSLDYPPHHLSRWAEDQLAMIAQTLDAELLSIAKQPLGKPQTIFALRTKELLQLLPLQFKGRDFIIRVLSRLALTFPLSLAWRKLRMAERFSMYGISLIAIIRKPKQ